VVSFAVKSAPLYSKPLSIKGSLIFPINEYNFNLYIKCNFL
jgi:hypothetical protein